MLNTLFDKLGDWNPQLLRELKGQLKPIKIGLAIALSIFAQIACLIISAKPLPLNIYPRNIQLTTFPEIQLSYDAEPTIRHLSYETPLEDHTGYGKLLTHVSDLEIGDRILAVDGVPFTAPPNDKQSALNRQLDAPFAIDLNRMTTSVGVRETTTQEQQQIIQSLRQRVPGMTVNVTIKRSGVEHPIVVALPRIVISHYDTPYCAPLQMENILSEQQVRHLDLQAQSQIEHMSGQFREQNLSYSHQYFYRSRCSTDLGADQYRVNWQHWHRQAFWALSIVIVFPLIVLGTYTLISNLLKEGKDGTLNFIRLSPQSARDIFLGKLLGVPVLIYGAIALMLPLHLIHGLLGEMGLGVLLSFYLATIAITFLYFSVALLIGLVPIGLGNVQACLGAGVLGFVQLLCWQASRYLPAQVGGGDIFGWSLLLTPFSILRSLHELPFMQSFYRAEEVALFKWFGIPMIPIVAIGLIIINSLMLNHWAWKALARRFFAPIGALLSKSQSYGLTLCLNLMILGFVWDAPQPPSPDPYNDYELWMEIYLLTLMLINVAWWLVLLVGLSPQRQHLQDWARYRHISLTDSFSPGLHSPPSPLPVTERKQHRRGRWSDLLWGERSPMVGAIAFNLAISVACILAWMAHHELREPNTAHSSLEALAALVACINVLMMATTLVQFVGLYREKHVMPTVLLILLAFAIGPPLLLVTIGSAPTSQPGLWFGAFPWVTLVDVPLTLSVIMTGLMAQWSVIGILNLLLSRQFKKIGASESKRLFTTSSIPITSTMDLHDSQQSTG